MDRFKSFLLHENKYYLGQKAGDLLTALQSLGDDASNIGNRTLIRAVQGIVNQIRRILHGRWDDGDFKYLKVLQKIGVALCKAIDEKEDIATVLSSAGTELEDLLSKMGVPVNSLGSEEETGEEPVSQEAEPLTPGMDINA
jgi:hypothetical protein